jgi:hypothetical protein
MGVDVDNGFTATGADTDSGLTLEAAIDWCLTGGGAVSFSKRSIWSVGISM